MIRLPPTPIGLGRSDLADFEKRRKDHRLGAANVENDFSRFSITAHSGSFFGDASTANEYPQLASASGYSSQTAISGFTLPFRPSIQPGEQSLESNDELSATYQPSNVDEDSLPFLNSQDDGHDQVSVEPASLENASHSHSSSSLSSKDDFHYGGFIESPGGEVHSDQSSPFIPYDVSTPKNNSMPGLRTFLTRMPLPRSPLFLSQNASSSPEHRPTSGLTPRVVSRIATHNTPGIIFAQPARRPPRRSPRTLRHQTNSFSFDSSERASAAYEQDRRSSTSTNDSNSRPIEEISLHEELRGSSLQSSRVTSAITAPFQVSLDVERRDISSQLKKDKTEESATEIIFSSPRLSLPPPFSTVSRTVSQVGSLPSFLANDNALYHPQTSPILASTSFRTEPALDSSPPTLEFTGRTSRAASNESSRILIAHRGNSADQTQLAGLSSGPELSRSMPADSPLTTEPLTPSRSYQVYNDSLSPGTQPQTPAHLPESRHRSRYHPSYTAPVTRGAVRRGVWSIGGSDGIRNETPDRFRPITTPVRSGRPTSPLGLTQGGFRGLYGGRENGDEEQNWVEGIHFNNAETRLWGSRDGRNDGRNLRETPEPEDWRVGRRN